MIANTVYMDSYMLEHPVLRPGKVCICSFPGSKATAYSELDPHDAFRPYLLLKPIVFSSVFI